MELENLVIQIQALSGSADDSGQLHKVLEIADEPLHSGADAALLSSFLDQLDPAKFSLGYLYVLEASTSVPVPNEQANAVVLTIAKFIDACVADQIRIAPHKFVTVCKRFKDLVLSLEAPLRGVYPMLTALRKLQTSSEHLTALHPEFLDLCFLSKSYKIGLSILGDDIYMVDQPRDLDRYCYYGGIICIGTKNFRRALELLQNVIRAQTNDISAIAVEAYKKYALVSLIHHGPLSINLPKYRSSVAEVNFKNYCQKPYIEFANIYNKGEITELENYIHENREKFEKDNNLGLAKQVVSSVYKHRIQRLTLTYLTLSLQDIADAVKLTTPKEAEMHVLQMIQDGGIFASINQKDGMVSFLEDPEQYNTIEMIEHIDSSIQRMMTLSNLLTSIDERDRPKKKKIDERDRQNQFDPLLLLSTRR